MGENDGKFRELVLSIFNSLRMSSLMTDGINSITPDRAHEEAFAVREWILELETKVILVHLTADKEALLISSARTIGRAAATLCTSLDRVPKSPNSVLDPKGVMTPEVELEFRTALKLFRQNVTETLEPLGNSDRFLGQETAVKIVLGKPGFTRTNLWGRKTSVAL